MGRGSETRDRIVAEARQVFARKGYDGATMAEIARRVQITEGAIYRHFAGKEKLFLACVVPVIAEGFARSLAEVEAARDLPGMVRALVQVRLELIERHLDTFDILFGEGLHRPELRELMDAEIRAQVERVALVVERLRRTGRLRRQPNLGILGLGMTAAMWAILRFRSEQSESERLLNIPSTRDQLVNELSAFMLHGLAGEPAEGTE
ncbi:MAG TPA: TetR/AcrR family transcriptional regulator [Firmicutes bacterium]|nr:TetR/AcrR family transcriptional regulator [Bacillota bacterium]